MRIDGKWRFAVDWILVGFAAWGALAWLASRPAAPTIAGIKDLERHFGVVALPAKLLQNLTAAAPLEKGFFTLLALAVLFACALAALYLARSARIPAARMMATSLASGAAAVAYVFFIRFFPELGADRLGGWAFPLDFAASGLYAWSLLSAMRFFASYPFAIDLRAFMVEEMHGRRAAAVEGWFPWMYRKVGAWKEVQTAAEREAASERFFRAFASPRGQAAIMLAFGLVGALSPRHALFHMIFSVVGVLAALYVFWFGLGCMRYKYRRGREEERQRIRWLYFGAWAAGLMLLGWSLFVVVAPMRGIAYYPVTAFAGLASIAPVLAGLIGLASLAISTLYRGTIDPDLAIRRTTVYAFLLAVLGCLFVAFERVLAVAVAGHLGLGPDLGSLVAAALAAVALLPLRRVVERGAQRTITRLTPITDLADGPRHVAAVAFSDLSGYTALTARDERAAMVAAALFHREAQRLAERHGGRLVKTIGDAVHLEFPTAPQAVAAVRELHESYARASAALALPALAVHSGVHCGEVMAAPDGDIYGTTVNVAARLQGQAADGEIVVSQAVRDACDAFRFSHRGPVALKNLPERMQLYLFEGTARPAS